MDNSEKISKVLSRAGIGSRRQSEKWIKEGKITVNGEIIYKPATRVNENDIITFEGKQIPKKQATKLWKFYKPKGTLSSNNDPKGRDLIFDCLAVLNNLLLAP